MPTCTTSQSTDKLWKTQERDLGPQPLRLFWRLFVVQLSILLILGAGSGEDVGPDLFALQVCHDPDRFRAIAAAWSESQRARFRWHYVLDAWYPLGYGLLFWRRATATVSPSRTLRVLQALAVISAACDVLENMLHIWALTTTGLAAADDWVVRCASVFATLKWATAAILCIRLRPGIAPSRPASARARMLLSRLVHWHEQRGQLDVHAIIGAARCVPAASPPPSTAALEAALLEPFETALEAGMSTAATASDRGSVECTLDPAVGYLPLESWAALLRLADAADDGRGALCSPRATMQIAAHPLQTDAARAAKAARAKAAQAEATHAEATQAAPMRVLVTGATGFLGREVVRRLLADQGQYVVTATGRDIGKGAELEAIGARFVRADLSERAAVIALCAGQDAVVHCAALCKPWPSAQLCRTSAAHEAANVAATAHVLAGCAAGGVHRLIHVSTPSLYFNPSSPATAAMGLQGVPEWVVLPSCSSQLTHYAKTKLDAEAHVQAFAFAHGASAPTTVVLRPRALIGPGDPTILPRVVDGLRSARLPVVGGGHSACECGSLDAHASPTPCL